MCVVYPQSMLNQSMTTLLRHQHGHIVPAVLQLQATGDSFIALIRGIKSKDEVILVSSKRRLLFGASESSMLMLGVG